jgi:hypothetical protein
MIGSEGKEAGSRNQTVVEQVARETWREKTAAWLQRSSSMGVWPEQVIAIFENGATEEYTVEFSSSEEAAQKYVLLSAQLESAGAIGIIEIRSLHDLRSLDIAHPAAIGVLVVADRFTCGCLFPYAEDEAIPRNARLSIKGASGLTSCLQLFEEPSPRPSATSESLPLSPRPLGRREADAGPSFYLSPAQATTWADELFEMFSFGGRRAADSDDPRLESDSEFECLNVQGFSIFNDSLGESWIQPSFVDWWEIIPDSQFESGAREEIEDKLRQHAAAAAIVQRLRIDPGQTRGGRITGQLDITILSDYLCMTWHRTWRAEESAEGPTIRWTAKSGPDLRRPEHDLITRFLDWNRSPEGQILYGETKVFIDRSGERLAVAEHLHSMTEDQDAPLELSNGHLTGTAIILAAVSLEEFIRGHLEFHFHSEESKGQGLEARDIFETEWGVKDKLDHFIELLSGGRYNLNTGSPDYLALSELTKRRNLLVHVSGAVRRADAIATSLPPTLAWQGDGIPKLGGAHAVVVPESGDPWEADLRDVFESGVRAYKKLRAAVEAAPRDPVTGYREFRPGSLFSRMNRT